MSMTTTPTSQAFSKGTKEWFQASNVCLHSCCCSAFGPLLRDAPWISTKEGSSIVLFGALKDSRVADQQVARMRWFA